MIFSLKFTTKMSSYKLNKYQGIPRLKYDSGDQVLICWPFSNAKAFGFIIPPDTILESTSTIEWGLVDIWNLDSSWISNFPTGNRTFPENIWNKISDKEPHSQYF